MINFGHSGMTKKLLWTNPNPNIIFMAQNIVLSGVYSNFDYLMVEYKPNKDATQILTAVFDKKHIEFVSNGYNLFGLGLYNNNSYLTRTFGRTNNIPSGSTNFFINSCNDNNTLIIVKIYGVTGKISGGVAKLLTHIKNTFFKLGGVF